MMNWKDKSTKKCLFLPYIPQIYRNFTAIILENKLKIVPLQPVQINGHVVKLVDTPL